MAIVKNPLTIVQGAPTPSAENEIITTMNDNAGHGLIKTKSGFYFDPYIQYCHGKLNSDKNTALSLSFYGANQFRVVSKFKNQGNENVKPIIFGQNALPFLYYNNNADQFGSDIYQEPEIAEVGVPIENVSVLLNRSYYGGYSLNDDVFCVFLYDESKNLLGVGYKQIHGVKNQSSNVFVGGEGTSYSLWRAKNMEIDIEKLFIEKDGVSVWGATNSKTQNMGVFNFHDFSEFEQIPFIQGDGNQYIDMGFAHNQNTRMVLDFEIMEYTRLAPIIGSLGGASGTNKWMFFGQSSSASSFEGYFGNGGYYVWNNKQVVGRHMLDMDKQVFTLDGTAHTFSSGGFSSNYNDYLFSYSSFDGKVGTKSKCKIYSCKCYENDVLIRDFVPVKHIKTGVLGLWDRENYKFYTNAGTFGFLS